MSEVIDLDVVVPELKKVRLGGKTYKVPGDMPMEIFLRLNRAENIKDEDGSPDNVAQLEALIEVITDLLVWELDDDDTDTEPTRQRVADVVKSRGIRFTFELMRSIYKPEDDAAEKAAADAPLALAPQDED